MLTRGADLVAQRVSLDLERGQVLSSVGRRPLVVYYYAVCLLLTTMLCLLWGCTCLLRDLFSCNNNDKHLSHTF